MRVRVEKIDMLPKIVRLHALSETFYKPIYLRLETLSGCKVKIGDHLDVEIEQSTETGEWIVVEVKDIYNYENVVLLDSDDGLVPFLDYVGENPTEFLKEGNSGRGF